MRHVKLSEVGEKVGLCIVRDDKEERGFYHAGKRPKTMSEKNLLIWLKSHW